MRMPEFIRETIATAKRDPLWGIAFFATTLMPLMHIVARAGIEICGGIIVLGFLWRSYQTKQWSWLRGPFMAVCLVAWIWLALVVSPLALTVSSSLTEGIMWFRLPVLFMALRYWVLATPSARATLGVILGCLLSFVALDCFWQFATGVSLTGNPKIWTGRLTGPFEGPKVGIYVAKLLVPAVALSLAAAWALHSKRGMVASLAVLLVALVAIILSGERSALLSTLLACGVAMGLMMFSDKRMRMVGVAAAAVTVALLATLYFSVEFVHLRGIQMLDTMEHYLDSDYGMLAHAGYDIGKAHLLHGVGLHNFRDLCPVMNYKGNDFQGMHPHNAYMEWFSEAGLPGLLIFCALIAALFADAAKYLRGTTGLMRLMPAVAIGVLVQNFFPLMGMQSFFGNWAAMLEWYAFGLVFAGLPARGRA